MKLRLALLSLLALSSSCIIVIADTDGDGERYDEQGHAHEPKWRTLFDGSSLEAFRGYRKDEAPAGWTIQEGALARVDGGGDLMTKGQWGSFELVFDWKVTEGANSGVMFHVTEDQGAPYMTGPEYQILDNTRHRDGGDPRTSAAANYALHAPEKDHTRPVGEWNHGRLVCEDGVVTHWLNGHKVVEYELWTDDWQALVEASKFDAMPEYGQRRRGHIVFQDHGDLVFYKDIRVRSL